MSLIKLNLCLKKHSCILTNNLSKSKTGKKYNLIADERIVILLHINEKSYQRVNILLLHEVFSHGKVRLPESTRSIVAKANTPNKAISFAFRWET